MLESLTVIQSTWNHFEALVGKRDLIYKCKPVDTQISQKYQWHWLDRITKYNAFTGDELEPHSIMQVISVLKTKLCTIFGLYKQSIALSAMKYTKINRN